jgi:predicted component of type VI protein secretion system
MALRLRVTSHQRGQLGDARVMQFSACGGTIGRAPDNDWVLPDTKCFVSGRHALIDFQAGAYYLVDTSRNGVFVNGMDTAVGRGHPQRLFDGDRLRIGEYEITVQITGGEETIPDDGMRDSVVRAQLVPLDESAHIDLVGESQMQPLEIEMVEATPPPAPALTATTSLGRKPAAAPAARTAPAPRGASGNLAELFLNAAGLQAADLGGSRPEETLQIAGQLLRELLTGITELIQTRSRVRDALRLSPGLMRPMLTQPPPSAAEALRQLRAERATAATLDEAVRGAMLDVKNHQQALFKAMIHALRDFTERFDPQELRGRFDQGLRRSALLAPANRLKYWDLYEESYQALTQHPEGAPLPQIVTDELARAYEQELDSLQLARTRLPAGAPASSG